jgi:hypothetical protein
VRVQFVSTDLYAWKIKLDAAVSKAPAEAAKVLGKGAQNIKRDARRGAKAAAGRAARYYPYSIGYDVYSGFRGPVAEIGPDKGRPQGPLGNLLEYGSVNNPPHPHLQPAGDRELPKFATAMQALSVKLLEGQ